VFPDVFCCNCQVLILVIEFFGILDIFGKREVVGAIANGFQVLTGIEALFLGASGGWVGSSGRAKGVG
jgi:hypothetical protein